MKMERGHNPIITETKEGKSQDARIRELENGWKIRNGGAGGRSGRMASGWMESGSLREILLDTILFFTANVEQPVGSEFPKFKLQPN